MATLSCPLPMPVCASLDGGWAHPITLTGWIVLALAAAILALKLRTRFLEKRTRILKALVAERTRDLAAANEALQRANLALREQSLTDPLTGLRNRRYLVERAPQDFATVRRHYRDSPPEPGNRLDLNRDLAFVMVDLDFFKAVNDQHGHAAGDAVLVQLADILRGATRNIDSLVRWGGEEFLVLARNVFPAELPALAERIRAQVEAHPFRVQAPEPLRLTCSLGFASFPVVQELPDDTGWEQVVALADACLYRAKQAGRNRWTGLVPALGAPRSEPDASGRPTADQLVARGLSERIEGPTGRG